MQQVKIKKLYAISIFQQVLIVLEENNFDPASGLHQCRDTFKILSLHSVPREWKMLLLNQTMLYLKPFLNHEV